MRILVEIKPITVVVKGTQNTKKYLDMPWLMSKGKPKATLTLFNQG
jgi:hypothetical protein